MNLKHTFVPAAAAAVLAILTSMPVSAQPDQNRTAQDSSAQHSVYKQTLAQKAKQSNKTKAKVSKTAAKQAPVNKVSQKDLDSALEMLDKALLLVKTEAREKAKPGKITNCAFDAMTLFMEDNKLTSDFFKQIDVDATPEEANKSLRSQFIKAANTYPQLMKNQMLTMAALKGIMRATDDPYTVYMTPDEYNLNEQMSGGNFGGIGIVMGLSGDEKDPANSRVLVINKVMEKGPAARVGLRNNDEITHISGKSTYGMSLVQCSKLLRGEAGSTVKLTIRRPSSGHVFNVSLTREVIHVDTLKHEVIEQDGVKVGYLALGIFGESTNSEMEAAVRDLEKQGCQAYIIDVRNNSGGYVSAAVDVCSKFVKTGSRIVSIVDGADHEQIIYSRPNLHSSQKPLVVLINSNSASASEFTAGAIRDLKRGQLVGVKSFGKGSVQKLYPYQFPANKTSAFKITTAHYHTPAGHDIHKAGLKPDVEVKMEDELILEREKDTQLKKALEIVASEAKVQQESAKKQEEAPQNDASITVNSVFDELPHIEKSLSGSYTITKRVMDVKGENVIDNVTVKTADGKEHHFRFIIKSKFGQ